ncbi:prostate and testis expressed protein 13-like [Peromyscus maniculatus bairdii]|uniref:Prostate and testis expressed 13 n=1 Tax=Peromyscus maniculatus bairdii TaxID=230844 RepID=A0A8C8TGT2_PERMB|nr:prostate and testis expressed protein 13-like [Peromyscus maniculatus bairdii]
MFRMLFLALSIILLTDTGERALTIPLIRMCNLCSNFDGNKCLDGMKKCWKFNMLWFNRTCTTENFYFYDILTGAHIFRYSKLSCKPCASGMFQVYHDLMRETFCCTDRSYCNDGINRLEMSSLYFEDRKVQRELND